MRIIPFIILLSHIAIFIPTAICADNEAQQLTGTYHSAVGKAEAYLDIDGLSVTDRIVVTGDILKDMPEGTRIWIKGKIVTWLMGLPYQQGQATVPHWRIAFAVTECKKISKPFELPSDTPNNTKTTGYQQPQATDTPQKAVE